MFSHTINIHCAKDASSAYKCEIVNVLLDNPTWNRSNFGDSPENVKSLDIWLSNFSTPLKLSTHFKNLEKLVLIGNYHNHSDPISTIFQGLEDLIEVQITRTKNSDFKILKTTFFSGLKNLQIIDLHQNKIIEIQSEVFDSQTKLKTIKLNMNQLTSLPKGLFIKNLNLKLVNLKDNQLKFISPQLFSPENAVEMIQVEGNCCIDGTFYSVEIFEEALINCTEPEQIRTTITPVAVILKDSPISDSMFDHYVFKSFFGKWSF